MVAASVIALTEIIGASAVASCRAGFFDWDCGGRARSIIVVVVPGVHDVSDEFYVHDREYDFKARYTLS
jgi:hypothetical protein